MSKTQKEFAQKLYELALDVEHDSYGHMTQGTVLLELVEILKEVGALFIENPVQIWNIQDFIEVDAILSGKTECRDKLLLIQKKLTTEKNKWVRKDV